VHISLIFIDVFEETRAEVLLAALQFRIEILSCHVVVVADLLAVGLAVGAVQDSRVLAHDFVEANFSRVITKFAFSG